MGWRKGPTPIEELEEWARRMVDQTKDFNPLESEDAWLEFVNRNLDEHAGAPTHRAAEEKRENQLDVMRQYYGSAVEYANSIKAWGRSFIKTKEDLAITTSAQWREKVIKDLNAEKGIARKADERKARSKEIKALMKAYPAAQEMIDASGMEYFKDKRGQFHVRDERGVFRSKDFLADRLEGTRQIQDIIEFDAEREAELEKMINPPRRKET